MLPPIVHHPEDFQFDTRVDGHTCVLDYQLRDGVMVITHTGVPPEVGGRGIAAALTRMALQTARTQGWRVVPICSYAAAYMRRHPENNDLVA